MDSKKLKYVFKLLISIIVCQCAGIIGSIFTTPAISTWYVTLQKPVFTPPNWLFAPAWVTLYLLMGVAASIIWHKGLGDRKARLALIIFLVQLVLNVLWSVVFFGLESPLFGMMTILVLWMAILLTILHFFKISTPAGVLLLPYIGWVTFAAILNISIFILNP
ncbi:TspO/MBR family protein [Chloroflexota bacterium]